MSRCAASELKTVPQRERKAKALQQSEAEGRHAAIEPPAADVFEGEVDDGQGEKDVSMSGGNHGPAGARSYADPMSVME